MSRCAILSICAGRPKVKGQCHMGSTCPWTTVLLLVLNFVLCALYNPSYQIINYFRVSDWEDIRKHCEKRKKQVARVCLCILKCFYFFNPFRNINFQTTNFRLFRTERICGEYFLPVENGGKFSKRAANPVGKGEIARYKQYFLLPQCLQKTRTADDVKTRAFFWKRVQDKFQC